MEFLLRKMRYNLALNACRNSEIGLSSLPINEVLTFEPLTLHFADHHHFVSIRGVTEEYINGQIIPIRFLNIQDIELN